MNLTQPPFDDVHVRKAMNWVMDRDGLRRAWGGPVAGDSRDAHHARTRCSADKLTSYDPFKTAGDRGRRREGQGGDEAVEVRHRQGRRLRREGVQGRPASSPHVRAAGQVDARRSSRPVAAKIGITFKRARRRRRVPDDPDAVEERSRSELGRGWGKDYADPSTFFGPLFDGRTSSPVGNTNYSLVGLTPEQAKQLGVNGTGRRRPEHRRRHRRAATLPTRQDARPTCWAALDKKLTKQIVPWVPYMWREHGRRHRPDRHAVELRPERRALAWLTSQ